VLCQPGQTTPCFDFPAANENGNLPYNGLNSPTFFNQDFSVIKKTMIPAVSETFGFEIRMEFFNAFNHANFTTLQTDINSSTFGQLTGVVDAVRGGGVNTRVIQWALRINW